MTVSPVPPDGENPDECQHLSCYGDGETLICIDCEQIVPPDDPKETTT